jgi:hypothetical protein
MSIWLLNPQRSGHWNCSSMSFKNKFAKKSEPNCPPYVCEAKQIPRKIVVATNGSTGGLSIGVERITSNEDRGGR